MISGSRKPCWSCAHHKVYDGVWVARTNIDIDDELIDRVMRRHGLASKRETVDFALRRLDVTPMTREQALAMQGSGWEGDLDEMRGPDRVAELPRGV